MINNIVCGQIIPMTIIFLIFAVCVLPVKVGAELNKNGLGIDNMTIIKGIACVMVIITHVCSQLNGEGILACPANIGFLAVGIFFFCSGYGLMYCYINKSNYIKHFLKKRMSSVLIPFFIANLIFILISHKNISGVEFIKCFLGIKLICGHFWYIQSIIVLYLIFYICARIFKDKRKMVVTLIIISLGYDIWWQIYNGIIGQSLPFVIGIVFAYFDLKWIIDKWNNKKVYIVNVIILSLIFIVTFFVWSILIWHVSFPKEFIFIDGILCQNIFVVLIAILAMKIKSNSRIGCYIGKNSYEIFLIHQISIDIFKNILVNKNISFILICSVALSIIMGSVFNYFVSKVIKNVSRL